MAAYYPSLSFIIFFFIFRSVSVSDAVVPPNETFTYVNQGDLLSDSDYIPYLSEYAPTYRPLPPFTFPFQLCFYNTTPNKYTLALRAGVRRDHTIMPWVWDANRGKPVGENATFSLRPDGNLVLAEANGRIVWQTNTARKGVVGFQIRPDGNIVLRDSNGKFVWQSFESPTDTLLVGQGLRVKGGPYGPYKLVSRKSVTDNVNGDYSLVLEPKRLALYYKNSMRYWAFAIPELKQTNGTIQTAKFRIAEAEYLENNFHQLQCQVSKLPTRYRRTSIYMGRVLYNSSLSYLRLGIDGNLRVYTYRRGVRGQTWNRVYTLFTARANRDEFDAEDECQLPNRCGKFGLCEDSQCVGCPAPNGVFAWSKDCDTKPPGCTGFTYYQLKGVDHFTVKYTAGTGPVRRSDCERKCSKDCKCRGYFYHRDKSRCWITYELKTLTRVGNSTSLAYIKIPVA